MVIHDCTMLQSNFLRYVTVQLMRLIDLLRTRAPLEGNLLQTCLRVALFGVMLPYLGLCHCVKIFGARDEMFI